MKYTFRKPLTGLDIDGISLKMVQVIKEKKVWRLVRYKELPLPPETLELSHKDENIMDPRLFLDTVNQALQYMSGRVNSVGLSLPNESVKVTTHQFKGLHESETKIRQLIAWKEKTTLPFPVEKAKISCFPFSPKSMEERLYLIGIGSEDIIRDYEMNLRHLKINPKVIRPAVINHLNFYVRSIKSLGIIAFLGLFEQYFTFFVFEDLQLIFYRGKRKSSSYFHFLQEIDMTVELFQREFPDKKIERLYVGSQTEMSQDMEKDIRGNSDLDFILLDENKIISMDQGELGSEEGIHIRPYISAIGAAKSLAD